MSTLDHLADDGRFCGDGVEPLEDDGGCECSYALLFVVFLPKPSFLSNAEQTDLLDRMDAWRFNPGLLTDLARRAAGADGILASASSLSCHALGLLAMRVRRRGLLLPSTPVAVLGGSQQARSVEGVALSDSSSMTDSRAFLFSSSPIGILIVGVSSSTLLNGATASSPPDPSSLFLVMLARLAERLVKELVMLVTLSLRIIDCADVRIICSLRARVVIPGKGRTSRVHTSESKASSLALSPRDGASTGIRPLVARRDCVRLMVGFDEETASFPTLVFRTTT